MDIGDFFEEGRKKLEEKNREEKETKKNYLFDLLNDLYHGKKYIFDDETKKDYNPWLINMFISGNIDTIFYAQQMNLCSNLEPQMQFDYYFHSLRKMKRFSKRVKKKSEEDIELIQEYYNYSRMKAAQVLKLHTEEDLEFIRKKLDHGGI